MEISEYKSVVGGLLKRHYLIDIERTPLARDQEIEKHMGADEPFELVSSFAAERGLIRVDEYGYVSMFEQGPLSKSDQQAMMR